MEKKTVNVLFRIGGFTLICLSLLFISVYNHEESHLVNCEYHWGKGEMHVNYFLKGWTTCDMSNSTAVQIREKWLVDSLIDGFGYQTNTILGVIILIGLLTVVFPIKIEVG